MKSNKFDKLINVFSIGLIYSIFLNIYISELVIQEKDLLTEYFYSDLGSPEFTDFVFENKNWSLETHTELEENGDFIKCVKNLFYQSKDTPFALKLKSDINPDILKKGDKVCWIDTEQKKLKFNLFESTDKDVCNSFDKVELKGLEEILEKIPTFENKMKKINDISNLKLKFYHFDYEEKYDFRELLNDFPNNNKIYYYLENSFFKKENIEKNLSFDYGKIIKNFDEKKLQYKNDFIKNLNDFCLIQKNSSGFFQSIWNFINSLFGLNSNQNQNLNKLFNKNEIKQICNSENLDDLNRRNMSTNKEKITKMDDKIKNYKEIKTLKAFNLKIRLKTDKIGIDPFFEVILKFDTSKDGEHIKLETIIEKLYDYLVFITHDGGFTYQNLNIEEFFSDLENYWTESIKKLTNDALIGFKKLSQTSEKYPNWFYDKIKTLNQEIKISQNETLQILKNFFQIIDSYFRNGFVSQLKESYNENYKIFKKYDILNSEKEVNISRVKDFIFFAGLVYNENLQFTEEDLNIVKNKEKLRLLNI